MAAKIAQEVIDKLLHTNETIESIVSFMNECIASM